MKARRTRRQRGGGCITREEVANILQELYPELDLEDDMDFTYVIQSAALLGTIRNPECLTFDEVASVLRRYHMFFTQGDPEQYSTYEAMQNARNRLQAHLLPAILKKQNKLRAVKNLGKKRRLPAQINSELASYMTGLPGNINSQLAQLNQRRQLFGENLAPRRNTRRRN